MLYKTCERKPAKKGSYKENKKQLALESADEITSEVERMLPLGRKTDLDFEMMEKTLRASALELMVHLVQKRLNEDCSDAVE